MTESIFDPTGPGAEHSGTRNLGPNAANGSHMPPEIIDAEPEEKNQSRPDEDSQTRKIADAEAKKQH